MLEMLYLENAVFIKSEPDDEPAEIKSFETFTLDSTPLQSTYKDVGDIGHMQQGHETNTKNIFKSLRTFSIASVKEEVESEIESDGKFTSEVFVGFSSESSDDLEDLRRTEVAKKVSLPAGDNIDRKEHKRKKKSKKNRKITVPPSLETMRVANSVNVEKDKQQETNRIIECCLCKKQFLSCKSVKKHILEHKSHFRNRCLICNMIFLEHKILLSHVEVHLKEKRFVCQVCGKTFRRSANLLQHEPTCGKEESAAELCTQCGKLCRSKWQLQQHMMFHSDVRPYPCSYCSKSFRFKTRLEEHQRTHLGIKPHTCTICNKSFTTSSDMKKHQKRHLNPTFKGYNTENNPNKLSECRVCNEKVVNLKNHMYLHYDKGRGTCNVCGKILKTKSLYQHLKIHLEGAPYQCDVCSRTFNRKDNMLSHRERHTRASYKPKVAVDNTACQVYGQTGNC